MRGDGYPVVFQSLMHAYAYDTANEALFDVFGEHDPAALREDLASDGGEALTVFSPRTSGAGLR